MAGKGKRGHPPDPPALRREKAERARQCHDEIQIEAEQLRLSDRPAESSPPYLEAFAVVAERHGITPKQLKRLLEDHCDVMVVRGDPAGASAWKPQSPVGRLAEWEQKKSRR